MSATERSAEPGEFCTCGRPAVTVYINEEFGEVGYCGIPGRSGPCPWCEQSTPHEGRCPEYRIRPATSVEAELDDPRVW